MSAEVAGKEITMFSTQQILAALRCANPKVEVSEDRIRHALRAGKVPWPRRVAGRLIWTGPEIAALSRSLGVNAPSIAAGGCEQ